MHAPRHPESPDSHREHLPPVGELGQIPDHRISVDHWISRRQKHALHKRVGERRLPQLGEPGRGIVVAEHALLEVAELQQHLGRHRLQAGCCRRYFNQVGPFFYIVDHLHVAVANSLRRLARRHGDGRRVRDSQSFELV